MEAVLGQDLRHLPAQPSDAAFRKAQARRHRPRAGLGMVQRGEHILDTCANVVKNPRKPVARYLDHAELERLGRVLDRHRQEHPWPVAAIRLLTLTEPRTIWWLGPDAARLVAALPRAHVAARVFPEDLTSDRLYTFWCGIREEAGLLRTPPTRYHGALSPSRRYRTSRRRRRCKPAQAAGLDGLGGRCGRTSPTPERRLVGCTTRSRRIPIRRPETSTSLPLRATRSGIERGDPARPFVG